MKIKLFFIFFLTLTQISCDSNLTQKKSVYLKNIQIPDSLKGKDLEGNEILLGEINIDQLKDRPEINNLITIYSSIANQTKQSVIDMFSNKEISSFKSELKDIVINLIEPISSRIKDIRNDKSFLLATLDEGANKARERASKTIQDINNLMGFRFD